MSSAVAFADCVAAPIRSETLDILQVNVGRLCNLGCRHCHLSCGPERSEVMNRTVMENILAAVQAHPFGLVDITGGAPELNGDLSFLIKGVRAAARPMQVRTNLVALLDRPSLMDLFKTNEVGLVASLPCYLEENVRAQRGDGVYEKSIECLRVLNGKGYGSEGGLPLALVYNPGGAFLPGPQADLENAYRKELRERHGVEFTRLYTITNLPIGRFGEELQQEGKDATYLETLRGAFNPETVPGLMCRHQICVDWDGRLYDCDFNLALGMTVNHGAPVHIRDFHAERLRGRMIVTADHCYGCTAGAGSSCGGALAWGDAMENDTMTARNRFEGGYNCAQAILACFGPGLGLSEDDANRLGAGLGGGFGNMGRTCGAVSGACLIIGLRYGSPTTNRKKAAQVNQRVRDFIRSFEKLHGTAICRGLIKRDISDEASLKRAGKEGVFDACPDYVESAEMLLRDMFEKDEVAQ
jgi:radical SAM/Cys-rich protein/C_GCAxxG_C_C family probable redox protein